MLDYAALESHRAQHPGWRLLTADHAALVASFLSYAFQSSNVRTLPQSELAEKLDDTLFTLRATYGEDAFPRAALQYLDDWARDDKGWLRKFYPANATEPHFDLTPGTEKALAWLEDLEQRSFVGTESRMLTVFDLLRQIVEDSKTDPLERMADLEKRRAVLDEEIARIQAGFTPETDETLMKERFHQMSDLARDLLYDFRQVEHNFRKLDRGIREDIARHVGSKKDLLTRVFKDRDTIAQSDQGRSFRAFWEFLRSPERQAEFAQMMGEVHALPAIQATTPDPRMLRVHRDWFEAGDHCQRMVASLSQQLRRYLDDASQHENRRVLDLLQQITASAVALKEVGILPWEPDFFEIAPIAPGVSLPMERVLKVLPVKPAITSRPETGCAPASSADVLFDQVMVDLDLLARNVQDALTGQSAITLSHLVLRYPLQHGLADLAGYLAIASKSPGTIYDEAIQDTIGWGGLDGASRQVVLPRIIFTRGVP